MNKIAIIGGGPAGLTALKSALDDGLNATLFEQSAAIGGQWNINGCQTGIWDSLHTNSSKYVTAFSDFPHKDDTELYPGHAGMLQYLQDYKTHFELDEHICLNTRIENIRIQEDGKYLVVRVCGGLKTTELFSHVISASGRFNAPNMPGMPGLAAFKGEKFHAFDYKTNKAFAGKKVLVIGNRISGLEVASDLSMDESITVISSGRKPKYILTKIINGQPGDHLLFTRYRNLAAQAFPPAVNAGNFKNFVLKTCGNPADFGGLAPSENIFEAGISACQNYLGQVKAGRIIAKGAIKSFTKNSVVFQDGTEIPIDAIIFATGYNLSLPFLSDDLLAKVNSGDQHLDLFKYTFHPDLPNMAFIGLYLQIGTNLPSFELQARWIAGCWSNNIILPGRNEMVTWIAGFCQSKKMRDAIMSQEMIVLFAQAAGVEPNLSDYPEFAGSLIFGPFIPAQFRLQGHGKLKNAKELYLASSAPQPHKISELDKRQKEELIALAISLNNNRQLQQLVAEI